MTDAERQRVSQIARLFPRGVDRLWCPLLVHFREDGSVDGTRISRHLESVLPRVRSFFAAGSTGEGWELDDGQVAEVLRLLLAVPGTEILAGALRPTLAGTLRCITTVLRDIGIERGDPRAWDRIRGLKGVVVSPPSGEHIPQADIHAALEEVLDLGFPTVIYNIPQVTRNEVAPETVSDLARRCPNMLMVKDTGGTDRIARSALPLHGVVLLRGAEGDYAGSLRARGGPYDGLLLSTANSFAPQLRCVMAAIDRGDAADADRVSEDLTRLVRRIFAEVEPIPFGNPFTNANKAADHWMAHGRRGWDTPPPRLHGGRPLPEDVVNQVGSILDEERLVPEEGYLDTQGTR